MAEASYISQRGLGELQSCVGSNSILIDGVRTYIFLHYHLVHYHIVRLLLPKIA